MLRWFTYYVYIYYLLYISYSTLRITMKVYWHSNVSYALKSEEIFKKIIENYYCCGLLFFVPETQNRGALQVQHQSQQVATSRGTRSLGFSLFRAFCANLETLKESAIQGIKSRRPSTHDLRVIIILHDLSEKSSSSSCHRQTSVSGRQVYHTHLMDECLRSSLTRRNEM